MKKNLGAQNLLYPSLTVLVGAHVHERPNFLAVAHVGIMTMEEISVGLGRIHHTNAGIREHGEFSVNIPSQDQMALTDYCGLITGKNTDKSGVFELFYGELAHAPLIWNCPVVMACRVERVVEFPQHEVFVGRVVESHADHDVLTDGKVDLAKVRPILFDMPQKKYWALGAPVGRAWHEGLALKK
ncbi:MAG: flavin reductase family protein [Deltaproteobacteria bacterium]|nr:flavin reductase family protein [Deltaproteobacteria bacterium]